MQFAGVSQHYGTVTGAGRASASLSVSLSDV